MRSCAQWHRIRVTKINEAHRQCRSAESPPPRTTLSLVQKCLSAVSQASLQKSHFVPRSRLLSPLPLFKPHSTDEEVDLYIHKNIQYTQSIKPLRRKYAASNLWALNYQLESASFLGALQSVPFSSFSDIFDKNSPRLRSALFVLFSRLAKYDKSNIE